MKVYVAGRGTEKWWAKQVMTYLEGDGHVITFDWTEDPTGVRPHWRDAPEEGQERALKELQGVKDCDVLVLLEPDGGMGCLFEAGMAMGLNKEVIVVGCRRNSVFFCMPNVHEVESVSDAQEMMR